MDRKVLVIRCHYLPASPLALPLTAQFGVRCSEHAKKIHTKVDIQHVTRSVNECHVGVRCPVGCRVMLIRVVRRGLV
jgi:hypothetical protein